MAHPHGGSHRSWAVRETLNGETAVLVTEITRAEAERAAAWLNRVAGDQDAVYEAGSMRSGLKVFDSAADIDLAYEAAMETEQREREFMEEVRRQRLQRGKGVQKAQTDSGAPRWRGSVRSGRKVYTRMFPGNPAGKRAARDWVAETRFLVAMGEKPDTRRPGPHLED